MANPGGGKVVPDGKGASSSYELRTGDVLYVPRGMPHLVRTATSATATADSVHRTIYRRPAYGEGHQAGLLRSALIGGDAPSDRIGLRPGTWPLITTGPETCLIEAGGRRHRVPAAVARACSLLGYGPMSVADLSADPEEAAEIAATLIGLGLAEQAGSRF